MSTKQLAKKTDIDSGLQEKAMEHLLQSQTAMTPQAMANELHVSVSDALELLSNNEFVALVHKKKIQLVRVFLNTTAVRELMSIVQGGSDRDRISASKLLFEIAGYREKGPLIALQQNFGGELQPGQPGWIDQQILKIDQRERENREKETMKAESK